MPLPPAFRGRLAMPAIAAPMFLASGPDLVVAACSEGLVGSFPALNCRSTAAFRDWVQEIRARLAGRPGAAPFGVNLIVHRSNPRLEADLAVCVDERVPLVITSLGAVPEVVGAVQGAGGLVFHDVISLRHAARAAGAGVDGLIAVCAGAGGHAGPLSPFALAGELRAMFDGTLVLAGAIGSGRQVLAAQLMGADMAHIGTRFLATRESLVAPAHKRMIVDSSAADVALTAAVSGVPANFLRPSLAAAGIDPEAPPHALDIAGEARVWRDIWSAGQGVGAIADIPPAAELCRRLVAEYRAALADCAGWATAEAAAP